MTLIFKINSFSFVAVETKKKENSKVLYLYPDPPKTLGPLKSTNITFMDLETVIHNVLFY